MSRRSKTLSRSPQPKAAEEKIRIGQPKDEGVRVARVSVQEFAGPLPPPSVLAAYNSAFHGCPERIVEMAERQARHRHTLEKSVIDGNLAAETRGQYLGAGLGFAAIVGGIGLIAFDKDTAGLTSIIATLVAFVALFIVGRTKQQRERSDKRSELSSQLRLPFRDSN